MSATRDGLFKQCGCPADQWNKCWQKGHAWNADWRHPLTGKRHETSLTLHAKRNNLDVPTTRTEAATRRQAIIDWAANGEKQTSTAKQAPVASETFNELTPKFVVGVLKARKVTKGEIQTAEGRFRKIAEVDLDGELFGTKPVADITETDVEQVFVAVTEELSDETCSKYRKLLRRFFKWAVRKGHLAVSPITDETEGLQVGKPARRHQRVRPDVEANLLAAALETRSDAAYRLWAIIICAIGTALRLGELLALQWRDIIWSTHEIEVRAVEAGARKGGKGRSRRVPTTPGVEKALRLLWSLHPEGQSWELTHYVFGDAIGGKVTKIRKAWVTCVLRAHHIQPDWLTGTNGLGVKAREAFKQLDLHFHDLRHEGAQRWHDGTCEAGERYTLGAIQRLLGHKDLATTMIYLGISEEEALREVADKNAAMWAAVAAENGDLAGHAKPVPAAGSPRGGKTAVKSFPTLSTGVVKKGGARRQVAS